MKSCMIFDYRNRILKWEIVRRCIALICLLHWSLNFLEKFLVYTNDDIVCTALCLEFQVAIYIYICLCIWMNVSLFFLIKIHLSLSLHWCRLIKTYCSCEILKRHTFVCICIHLSIRVIVKYTKTDTYIEKKENERERERKEKKVQMNWISVCGIGRYSLVGPLIIVSALFFNWRLMRFYSLAIAFFLLLSRKMRVGFRCVARCRRS